MALNKWLGIGRLTKNPELKQTPTGVSVCAFSIAVNRTYQKDKVDFLNIVAWRATAEFVCKYFQKGDPIQIVGHVEVREYTDKDGNKRQVTEIIADEVSFVEGYKRNDNSGSQQNNSDDFGGFEEVGAEEELPF